MIATLDIPATREEWLQARKSGIGGTDVAPILGLSRYRTPWEVWADKTGKATTEETDAMRRGRNMEPVVRAEYEHYNETTVDHGSHLFTRSGVFVASPDALDGDTVVEFKTANYFAFKTWGETIPMDYWLQMQHYMYVLDKPDAVLSVLVGGSDYREIPVARDNDYYNTYAKPLEEWWNVHIVGGTEPAKTSIEEPQPLAVEGTTRETDAVISAVVDELKTVKDLEKSIKEKRAGLESEIKSYFGEAETITDNGKAVATWKQSTRTSIDTKALRKNAPDIADEYTKTTITRTLRIQ